MSIRKGIKSTVETGEDILTIVAVAGAAYLAYQFWNTFSSTDQRTQSTLQIFTGDADPKHDDPALYYSAVVGHAAANSLGPYGSALNDFEDNLAAAAAAPGGESKSTSELVFDAFAAEGQAIEQWWDDLF